MRGLPDYSASTGSLGSGVRPAAKMMTVTSPPAGWSGTSWTGGLTQGCAPTFKTSASVNDLHSRSTGDFSASHSIHVKIRQGYSIVRLEANSVLIAMAKVELYGSCVINKGVAKTCLNEYDRHARACHVCCFAQVLSFYRASHAKSRK